MTAVAITGLGAVSALGANVDELACALRGDQPGIGVLADGTGEIGAALDGAVVQRALEAATAEPRATSLRKLTGRGPLGMRAMAAAAMQAVRQAGLEQRHERERIALVVAGNNLAGRTIERMQREHEQDAVHLNPRYALQFLDTHYIGVLSELLSVRGSACTVGATSASGNVALVRALEMLAYGSCDACVVAAPPMELSQAERRALRNAGALYSGDAAPQDACRPFDAGHAGFVYGEAAACVVLERDPSGARVLGQLLGGAVALDASSSTHPSRQGELQVMRQALRAAKITPRELGLISAHGSSSPLGDRTELAAIVELLGESAHAVPINALKGLSGHCLSSASLLELIAVVIQLRDGFVHGNVNLTSPISDGCRLPRVSERDLALRFALSNAFAFGGINSAVVIARGEG